MHMFVVRVGNKKFKGWLCMREVMCIGVITENLPLYSQSQEMKVFIMSTFLDKLISSEFRVREKHLFNG